MINCSKLLNRTTIFFILILEFGFWLQSYIFSSLIPIQFMGIANMANNTSKLSAAFNFGENIRKSLK